MPHKTKTKASSSGEQLVEFVAEIDRFGLLLESQEAETRAKTEAAAVAKAALDEAKRELSEAKEVQLATVAILLKLIRPGQPRTYPLFDRMEDADEEAHGHGSDEWRKEPIAALRLSGAAMRALIDADIVNEISAGLTVFFQHLDRLASPTLLCLATNMRQRLDPALLSRVELAVRFDAPTADQAVEFVLYWSELLAEHGGEEWGPRLIADGLPRDSFRAMKQHVAAAAREWIMAQPDT